MRRPAKLATIETHPTMTDYRRQLHTVDLHTGGEPLRVLLAGLPPLPEGPVLTKRAWLREHHDDLRRFLMLEPRGHADMYGAYLFPAVTPQADFGVVFIHNEGYSDMCGHGIIALGKLLVELGHVPRQSPRTRIGFDSPAGHIEAWVEWDGQRAGRVTFRNVPGFIYRRDVTVQTAGFGRVTGDVVFGGAFYYYLSGAQAGLAVEPDQVRALIELGAQTKAAVAAQVKIQHPLQAGLDQLYGSIIDGPANAAGADQSNVCIFADREVDRSPTGTGTSGRAVQLFLRGRLALNQPYVNASIVGSRFEARVVEAVRVGPYDGAVTEVSGEAHIMGFHLWVLERDDPFPRGFFLR